MLLNKLKLNKDNSELLVISSLHRARPPLSHIHVCDERCAGFTKKRETLEFSSMNLWEWFLRWQQCANPHSIVSVKLGSFVNISPLMQPSFLFKLLLHQSLTTEIRYCMVYLRTWLNSSNVCRTQLLVFLLFRPSSVILQLFLRIFTGSRFISRLNLKYLSLPQASLSMDLLPLILKTFFKVTSRHGI